MKIFLLFWLLLLLLKSCKTDNFDPKKYDYCERKCPKIPEEKHTACKCEETKGKNELLFDKDPKRFQKLMLENHNYWRNFIASGKEKNCPTASDMNILKYNLEMEYIAQCYSKINTKGHDKCRITHDSIFQGQNIYRASKRMSDDELPEFFKIGITAWYQEINTMNIPDKKAFLGKFYGDTGAAHFTQMIWATTTHVGCAMSWIPDISMHSLVCNYGGFENPNLKGRSVYKFGKPCSQCPNGTSCLLKSNYPALCGDPKSDNTHTHGNTSQASPGRIILLFLGLYYSIFL